MLVYSGGDPSETFWKDCMGLSAAFTDMLQERFFAELNISDKSG